MGRCWRRCLPPERCATPAAGHALSATAVLCPRRIWRDICQQEWQRLLAVLVSLGYSRRTQEMFLSAVLSLLMLENGDPRREFYRGTADTRSAASNGRDSQSRGESVSWAGGDGYSAPPVAHAGLHRLAGEKYRRHRTGVGNFGAGAGETSVLRPKTRESCYSIILRIGLWLAGNTRRSASPKTGPSASAPILSPRWLGSTWMNSHGIITPARFIAWRPADEEQFPGVLPVCPAAFSSTMNSGAGDGCNSAPIAIWPRPTPRPSAVASIPG